MHRVRKLTPLALALATACGDQPPPSAPIARAAPCAEPDAQGQPLDQVLAPHFAEACLLPLEEAPELLCRRLMTDLLGRFPTRDELEARCLGRPYERVVLELQHDERHVLQAERYWARTLFTYDSYRDPFDVVDLFERIHALERSQLRYDDFVVELIGHPAWLGFGAYDAELILRAFLGRDDPREAESLGRMFSAWRRVYGELHGFANVDVSLPVFDKARCLAQGGCDSEMFGGMALDLTLFDERVLSRAEMSPEQRAAIDLPARRLIAQPRFFEAAADALLDRYLDWDEGGSTLRTPGALFPELRQVLADELARSGDYPAAERLVLGSWLYRQRTVGADADGERPVFAVGPIKRASNLTWLDSALRAAPIDLGLCDPRFPTNYALRRLEPMLSDTTYYPTRSSAKLIELHDLVGMRTPLVSVDGQTQIDTRYQDLIANAWGCRDFSTATHLRAQIDRRAHVETLCDVIHAAGPTAHDSPAQLANRWAELHISRDYDSEESALFVQTFTGTIADDPAGLSSAVCRTVLESAEALFY